MSEEARNFLNNYGDFVTKVTSEPSLDQASLDERMKEIDASSPIESARLLTAALGLGSERTLDEYASFSGIDLPNKQVLDLQKATEPRFLESLDWTKNPIA